MPGFESLWFNKVAVQRREADDAVATALRKAGWLHTSSTPGSRWMWQKQIGGQIYSVSEAEAARIQEIEDRSAYFKVFPDELGD